MIGTCGKFGRNKKCIKVLDRKPGWKSSALIGKGKCKATFTLKQAMKA